MEILTKLSSVFQLANGLALAEQCEAKESLSLTGCDEESRLRHAKMNNITKDIGQDDNGGG